MRLVARMLLFLPLVVSSAHAWEDTGCPNSVIASQAMNKALDPTEVGASTAQGQQAEGTEPLPDPNRPVKKQ